MTAPRGNHSDSHLNQILAALGQYIDTVTVPVPLTTTTILRVDTAGNNGTALPGRFDLPYLTITAALAASVNGDTILIGPGTFNETVVIPAARTSMHIVGSGMYSTVITPVGGADTLSWISAAAVMTRLCISNLSLVAGAGQGLVVTATAQPTSFDEVANARNGLYLDHVFMSSTGATAATFSSVTRIVANNCVGAADAWVFTLCGSVDLFECSFGATTFTYTVAGAKPANALRAKNLHSCVLLSLTVNALDGVVCDSDCIVTTNITTVLLDNALGVLPTSLEFHGTCIGNMVLGHTFALGARLLAFVCDRCKLVGTLALAGLGVSRASANFRNAVLDTAAGGGISVGAVCDLDLVGARFTNDVATLVAVGNGTCNRSIFRTAIAVPGAGAVIYTFATDPGGAACPFTDANFSVSVETTAANDDPLITVKNAAGFTYNLVAGATAATFTVIHD